MKSFIFTFFIVALSLNAHSAPYMLTIKQSIIQSQIDQSMPIEKTNFIGTALIDNPQIDLNGKMNKIEFWVDFDAIIFKKINAIGKSKISATLYYKHDEGAFYLHEPIIEELIIDNVKDKYIPIYKNLLQVILKSSLKKYPIYQFDEQDLQQKFAKASLKSVAIGEKELIVVMDMGI